MKTNRSKSGSPRVLCGTDFSPAATRAADVACCLAKQWDLPLELAHVSAVPAEPTLAKKLKAAAEPLRARGLVVRDVMLEGSPDEELVRRAMPKSCRLVVVSSLGKRAVKRWLLGSVSERTAQRAAVPTLVVRESAPFESWTRGVRPLKVFVAFNFTATSEAALAWVETLQSIGPCDLTVGYVDFPLEQKKRLGGSLAFGTEGNPPEIQELSLI
ncbi:MAG: hypothetical protein RLZZ214_4227, partial [Verrucomicrobiota bacterium]